MKVRCLRGVCVGIDDHMVIGDLRDLDAALVTFLSGIGAVERVPDEPVVEPVVVDESQEKTRKPRKAAEAPQEEK